MAHCPCCHEVVKEDARKCPHCHEWIVSDREMQRDELKNRIIGLLLSPAFIPAIIIGIAGPVTTFVYQQSRLEIERQENERLNAREDKRLTGERVAAEKKIELQEKRDRTELDLMQRENPYRYADIACRMIEYLPEENREKFAASVFCSLDEIAGFTVGHSYRDEFLELQQPSGQTTETTREMPKAPASVEKEKAEKIEKIEEAEDWNDSTEEDRMAWSKEKFYAWIKASVVSDEDHSTTLARIAEGMGLFPEWSQLFYAKGVVHHARGEFAEAEAAYREAIRLNDQERSDDPLFPPTVARNNLASLLAVKAESSEQRLAILTKSEALVEKAIQLERQRLGGPLKENLRELFDTQAKIFDEVAQSPEEKPFRKRWYYERSANSYWGSGEIV